MARMETVVRVPPSVVWAPLLAAAMVLALNACGRPSGGGYDPDLTGPEALVQTGRQRARTCIGCHGPQGISRVRSYPSIAGLPKEYLQEQMRAYRSGEIDNPMMGSVARNLSDADIEALSYYYASLPGPEDQD